jgi:hypothetical protein
VIAKPEPQMSSSVRSGRTAANPARHCGLPRETARPAAPVRQTLKSQIQSKPCAAKSSIALSSISAKVIRRPATRDKRSSQTRVLI